MSDDLRSRILDLPPKRLALLALELREQLEQEREKRTEPIAVIGMACRFPGADSVEAFWRLLDEGRDAIAEVPSDRWDIDALYDPDPDAPGRIATRWGGFLDDVQNFDAGFFSISPREARALDPQQRLLLETSWRAFEDAAIPPSRWYGKAAGVFVGLCNNDYLSRLLAEGAESIDVYFSSGNAYSVAAGRLAFTFGFQGPAVTIDTACSSSLVALHAACQSLRNGECELAVAGGANVMSSAETSMALSRAHMMAPDGRCKTFDDRADGFVRAEGCGIVVLKRLSDALRDRDRIHALIRGTAIGQDGRSTGLTVPNGPAQEQVIRDALERSRLQPADIDYIEAHGTGTRLGDPIEIRALGRVFGRDRTNPLVVGSVKTNFGHLESAAGIAGVIKAILSIREDRIPAHLHFETPSRHIEWDELAIDVPATGRAWPDTGRPRRAGVSSFGFSGTNAHVVVEAAPADRDGEGRGRGWSDSAHRSPTGSAGVATVGNTAEAGVSDGGGEERNPELLLISAATPEAREELTHDYGTALQHIAPEVFADFCHTTRVGRTAFGWRRAVLASSPAEARAALLPQDALEHGENAAHADKTPAPTSAPSPEPAPRPAPTPISSESRVVEAPDVGFLFTGQGAQFPGMGRALYDSAPAFRAAIDRCAAVLDPILPVPLRNALFEGEGENAPIYRTAIAQPAVVAFEWALAQLWAAWGVRPAAVMGHSLGEFVAACVAGVLTLEDMLRLVAERGRLLDSLPTGDRMTAVFAPAELVLELLGDTRDAAIAAYNAPDNTVISGRADVVARAVEQCAARGIESRELRLDRGFHSPRVEPVLAGLNNIAATIPHHPATLPIALNVTGQLGAPTAGYWRDHARAPVRFLQGVQTLAGLGILHFLEVGPHPTLSPLVAQILDGTDPVLVPTLRRGGDARTDALEAAARLWVAGVDLDFAALDADRVLERIAIPGHPLHGDRYWVDPPAAARITAPRGVVPGIRLPSAVPIFEAILTPGAPAFLAEHRFRGDVLVPGPVYLEAARAAARALDLPVERIADFELLAPAVVPSEGLRLQTVIDQRETTIDFRVLSLPVQATGDARWTEHARGRLLASIPDAPEVPAFTPTATIAAPEHLSRLRELGYELGPAAARWSDVQVGGDHGQAQLLPTDGLPGPLARALILDAAIQVLGAVVSTTHTFEPRLLVGIDEVTGDVDAAVRCVVAAHKVSPDGMISGDVLLLDAADRTVGWMRGVRLGRVAVKRPSDGWFHRLEWRLAPLDTSAVATVAAPLVEAVAHVEAAWPAVAREAGLQGYIDALPTLRVQVARYIAAALTALGFDSTAGAPVPPDLADRLGIVPSQRHLLPRLLAILKETGWLSGAPGDYRVTGRFAQMQPGTLPSSGAASTGRDASAGAPDGSPGTAPAQGAAALAPVEALIERCGAALADVLAGAINPLDLLFPAGDPEPTRAVYADSPFGRAFNEALRVALDALTDGSAAPVQLLEVGGGSGTTTRAALEALRGRSFHYVFTDISANLVRTVERSLGGSGGLEFRKLDIESDPVAQGFTAGKRHIVIAANVLHATQHINRSLAHLHRLLAPGGVLLLLEGSRPEPWVDITFGLTPGWWRFADRDVRPDYPLLTAAGWTTALQTAGFEAVQALPAQPDADAAGQVILVARKPGVAVPTTDLVFDVRRRTPVDLLGVMQRLVEIPEAGRLRVLTFGARAVGPHESADPRQAVFWGLARTFALEHPDRWGGIIDFAADTPEREVTAVLDAELRATDGEDQVTWRGNVRRVPRLVGLESLASISSGKGDASYAGTWVITGGLGGLGLKVARWLASRGVERLVLLGRSAALSSAERSAVISEIEQLGVRVLVRAVDVTSRSSVDGLLHELRAAGPPIRGIVHAAAVFDATPLTLLTAEQLDAVLAPKIRGLINLADATTHDPLDAFVLFSSTTSILGVAGLGAYAAANQYLDAFVYQARAGGRPVVSINWGTWDEMRLAGQTARDLYARAGLRPMPSDAALEAMGQVIAAKVANVVVASVDWERLRNVYELRRRRPMLAELGTPAQRATPERSASPSGVSGGVARRIALTSLNPADRRIELQKIVEHEVRTVLRIGPERVLDVDQGFFELGMDSLMSVELKGKLEGRFAMRLPATLTFNHPTVGAVVRFVDQRFSTDAHANGNAAVQSGPAVPATGAPTVSSTARDPAGDDIAARLAERVARLEQGDGAGEYR